MKILFISALVLPFLSACTAPTTNDKVASSDQEELVYVTGSNMPAKRSKSSIITMTPEQAAAMQGFSQSRAVSN